MRLSRVAVGGLDVRTALLEAGTFVETYRSSKTRARGWSDQSSVTMAPCPRSRSQSASLKECAAANFGPERLTAQKDDTRSAVACVREDLWKIQVVRKKHVSMLAGLLADFPILR